VRKRNREAEEVFATMKACLPNNTPAVDPPQRGRLSQRSLNEHAPSLPLGGSEASPRIRENRRDTRLAL